MSANATRPRELHEVARRAIDHEQDFDIALREFLDSFYADPDRRVWAIRQPPEAIDPLRDAYLAAVAEHLARMYGLAIPEWAETRGLDLTAP
jgi:hypothetical protein